MAYDFHYTPTGTGVISGKEVLEQTEDAINDLGTQISGDVQTAINTANNALNTANSASADAQNAVNTANTAYTTAQNAQNTANTAQNTASNALTAAQNAQNDVNALGNRVTTAEGNITQNTTDITNLTTRMGTAEGNITTLQSNVSTAQATANSAQQTANTARQQSYILRYSSSSVTDNSTIAYSTIDNTDNIKVGDKILDVDGKLFEITAVDTANQTVTVGSALIDLALDANVMHLSGNETAAGNKTFTDNINVKKIISNVAQLQINAKSNADSVAVIAGSSASEGGGIWIYGKNSVNNSHVSIQVYDTVNSTYHAARLNMDGSLTPTVSNNGLGSSSYKWVGLNGINPGVLSFPDLSSGLDISAYISVSNGQNILSTYTAPADGWISINLGRASGSIGLIISNGSYSISARDNSFPDSHRECPGILPVFKNDTVSILSNLADSVLSAYFYPCKGNV